MNEWDVGDVSLDDLSLVPDAPIYARMVAVELWAAWRVLPRWRERVDAELSGNFARLLPALAFMPRAGLDGAEADASPFADAAADEDVAERDEPDEIPEEILDFLREELYRSIFALGAAWAQTRCERS